MWPLGHAAVGYLCYSALVAARFDRAPDGWPVLALLVGTQFPDLIDKPLAWYVGTLPTGRSLSHTLLLLVPLCAVIVLVAKRWDRGETAIAFAVGALSHAVVDALPLVLGGEFDAAGFLVWPLVSVGYEEGPPSVLALLRQSAGDPYFYLEFVLAAIAFAAWYSHGRPGLRELRRFSPV